MRSEQEMEFVMASYADSMYRLALHSCLFAQAQDVVQDALIRYMKSDTLFNDEEHRKAWLFRVVLNLCTDYHRHWWQKFRQDDPEQRLLQNSAQSAEERIEEYGVLEYVRKLPRREAIAVYLFYYEQMPVDQICAVLECRSGTVYSLMTRGRQKLKKMMEKDGALSANTPHREALSEPASRRSDKKKNEPIRGHTKGKGDTHET